MKCTNRKKVMASIFTALITLGLVVPSAQATSGGGIFVAGGPDYETLSGSVMDGAGNTYSAIQFSKSFKIGAISFINPSPSSTAIAVLKVSSAGKILWSSPIASSTFWTGFEEKSKLIVDENGNVSAVFVFNHDMDFAGKKYLSSPGSLFDYVIVQIDGDDGKVLWTQYLGKDQVSPVGTFGGSTYFLIANLRWLRGAAGSFECEASSRIVSMDATGAMKDVFSSIRSSSEFVNIADAKLNYKGDLLLLAQKRDQVVQSTKVVSCDEGPYFLLKYEIASQKMLSSTNVFSDSSGGRLSAEILDSSQTGKSLVCNSPFVESGPSVMQISLVDDEGKLLWTKNADRYSSSADSCISAVFDKQENIRAVLIDPMKTFLGKKVEPVNKLIIAKIAVNGSLKELKTVGSGKYVSVGPAISRDPSSSAFLITAGFQGRLSIAGKRVALTNNRSDSFLYKLPNS